MYEYLYKHNSFGLICHYLLFSYSVRNSINSSVHSDSEYIYFIVSEIYLKVRCKLLTKIN